MNFLEQARNVQSVGAANSKNDTVLAHITPKEAAILKLLGGSGRRDPKTGALHFEDDTDGSEVGGYGNDNEGYGGTGRTSSTGTSRPENTKNYNEAMRGDNAEGELESLKRELSALPEDPNYEPNYIQNEMDKYKASGYNKNYDDPYANLDTHVVDTYKKQIKNPFETSIKTGLGYVAGNLPGAILGGAKAAQFSDPVRVSTESWTGPYGSEAPSSAKNLGNSSTRNTPGLGMNAGNGGNGLGSLGSAALGGGLGYALGSVGSSNKSTQMYTDPVTGQLLPYLDAGLNERVANENLDNTIANQLRAQDDLNARRGMGMSTMQDATRASLGLSTAQTRNANRLTAQEIQAQRDLAAQTAAKQDALAQANLRYLQGVQDDANRNAWIKTAGDVAGSIDWDSLF